MSIHVYLKKIKYSHIVNNNTNLLKSKVLEDDFIPTKKDIAKGVGRDYS